MNIHKCAENIIAGAGGYENITSIRRDGLIITIGLRNDNIIQSGLIKRNDMVRECRLVIDPDSYQPNRKCGELRFSMKPGDVAGIYNKLCTLCKYYELQDREEGVPRHNLEEDCRYLEKAGEIFADSDEDCRYTEKESKIIWTGEDEDFADPDEDCGPNEDCGFTEACGDDEADEYDEERRPVPKGKYTAGYFINAAEKAAGDLSLLHVEKNAVMGFVFMIAEEAARFANEKGLDDEFTLVPEFVGTLMNAEEKDGRMEISGNVFISDDKSACVSVQYQKNGDREAYNVLVTDIEGKNRVSYAGEINGPADADEEKNDGTAETRKEGKNSGDGEKPAGTGAPNWVSHAGETNGPKNADKEESAGTDVTKLLTSIMIIMMIISMGMMLFGGIMPTMQGEKDYATEHNQQENAGVQYESDSSDTAGETTGKPSEKYTQEEFLKLEMLSIATVVMRIIGIIAVLVGITKFAVCYNEKDKDGMSASVKPISTGILLLIMATVISSTATSIAAAM